MSRLAKRLGFRVIANDWEPYSQAISSCCIAQNAAPAFETLGGYASAIAALNALPGREDWVTRHLCPAADTQYDLEQDRLFYTRGSGMKMDAIRTQIEAWRQAGTITAAEEACLLAPLLYQACYVSNTSGVFKGFHNGWGGQTGTALYRILSALTLSPAAFYDNGLPNAVFGQDAVALARHLRRERQPVDIAYLDPPCNQHPYASNYHVLNHVLNTLALWDKPALSEKIEGRNKAAIREDWRTERRSPYNYSGQAEQAYRALMETLDARFVLTSYSTNGMIPLQSLLRVSAQRFSKKPLNVEFILIVDTNKPHTDPGAAELAQQITEAEIHAVSQHPETISPVPGDFAVSV